MTELRWNYGDSLLNPLNSPHRLSTTSPSADIVTALRALGAFRSTPPPPLTAQNNIDAAKHPLQLARGHLPHALDQLNFVDRQKENAVLHAQTMIHMGSLPTNRSNPTPVPLATRFPP